MKREMSNFEKRKAKVPILLDEDDFYILYYLAESNHTNTPPFPEITKLPNVVDLDQIKNYMNFSHNSLLTHMRRLSKLGFIEVIRKSGLEYKYKLMALTPPGRHFFECFWRTMSSDWRIYLTEFKSEKLSKSKEFQKHRKKLNEESMKNV